MKTKNRLALASLAASPFIAIALMAGPVSAAMLSQQLDMGEQGDDVTSLQTFLAADPSVYPSGLITGYFGPLTAAAVSKFQANNGLAVVGRVGPQTLALINSQMGGTVGTPLPSGDISAPIISVTGTSVTTNSGTINWTTNEAATSRVMYGTSWPFIYASAPSVGSATGVAASGVVTLPNLQSNTTYYYTIESVDASGNLQWSTGNSFKTN